MVKQNADLFYVRSKHNMHCIGFVRPETTGYVVQVVHAVVPERLLDSCGPRSRRNLLSVSDRWNQSNSCICLTEVM